MLLSERTASAAVGRAAGGGVGGTAAGAVGVLCLHMLGAVHVPVQEHDPMSRKSTN